MQYRHAWLYAWGGLRDSKSKKRRRGMNPVKGIINSLVVDLPLPGNLMYLWGFLLILGVVLGIQMGKYLAIHDVYDMGFWCRIIEISIAFILELYGVIFNFINKLEGLIIIYNNNIIQGLMGILLIIYWIKKSKKLMNIGGDRGRKGGGGKRKWDIRSKLKETWLGEIIINPEGDLISEKYGWLKKGGHVFGLIVLLNWLTKWICKYIIQIELVEGKENLLLELIMLLSNLVMWMIILMMVIKAVIMTKEISRRVYRGAYTVEIPGGERGLGVPRKPQKRVIWSTLIQEVSRVSWQIIRATIGIGAGFATTGMALDWYGQVSGRGNIGTNIFRTVGRGIGANVPRPEWNNQILREDIPNKIPKTREGNVDWRKVLEQIERNKKN